MDGFWFIAILLLLIVAWLLVEGVLIHHNPIGWVLERAEDHLDHPNTGSTRRRFWRMVRSVIVATAFTLLGLFVWRSVIQSQTTKPPSTLRDVLIDTGADLARKTATQAVEHPEKAKQMLRNLAETR